MSTPIVVAGGGLAAAKLAGSYRESGGREPVTILSAESRHPYSRPPLSKGVLRGEMADEKALVHPPAFYEEQDVDLVLGVTVTGLDVEAHTVALENGSELPYGRLVVATGARPRRLPVPGADLDGVHTYRTVDDARAVREEAARSARALVVGGSFIGSEVAASLRLLGLEVTVVEMGDLLMPALSSTEVSRQLEALYRERGVDVRLGASLAELVGRDGRVAGARLASGEEIEADLVVVGVGVTPNVDWLQGSPVDVDDGVLVDEGFRTSAEDVFAIGDVARFPDRVAGRPRRIEHWTSANAQGAHLGRMLAGSRAPYEELAVFFTQLFDVKLQVLGDPDGGVDDVSLAGSVAEGSLLGLYTRDGRVIGAVLTGQSEDTVEQVKAVVRERPQLDVAEELLGGPVGRASA
jgi:3-phenylpropionate/trans-cinnamate dioxygenase ferredoxin reductase subunit